TGQTLEPCALQLPGQHQQRTGHQQRADAMSQVNRRSRRAVEFAAQVIGADVLSQMKAVGKVSLRPPLALTQRQ
nr:hypothetical protein [Tanacetum cinerariifolium]